MESGEIGRRDFLAFAAMGMAMGSSSALAKEEVRNSLLRDKTVLITGGAKGLGEACTKLFANLGAKVAFCERTADRGKALEKEITAKGGKAKFFKADITSEKEVKEFVEFTVKTFSKLDIAVNNAGITRVAPDFTTVPLADLHEVITTNLLGTMLCMKYEIAQMLRQGGGKIINVASVASVGSDFLCANSLLKS